MEGTTDRKHARTWGLEASVGGHNLNAPVFLCESNQLEKSRGIVGGRAVENATVVQSFGRAMLSLHLQNKNNRDGMTGVVRSAPLVSPARRACSNNDGARPPWR